MATPPLLQLPNDVVIEILTQLKRVSDTTQDLTSCSRVNKAWHEAATPLLYGNIALNTNNITSFHKILVTEKYAADIHSISISLQPREAVEPVAQLASLLPQFLNLRSFSFWLSEEFTADIPQHVLVQLVEALPPSCTDLELDTLGFDKRSTNDTTHLCSSLRAILPRLRHVRLRLRTCEALFADLDALKLPLLKTLLYNCINVTPIPTCQHQSVEPVFHYSPLIVWNTVTSGLTSVVVPPDAKLYAFMTTDHEANDFALWPAHVLADFQEKKSTVLPTGYAWLESDIRGSQILRLPDGREIMSTPAGLEAVAEGQLWVSCRGGARLARQVVKDSRDGRPSFAQGCVEKEIEYLKSSDEWRAENPWKKCITWINEEETGVTLMRAVERSGDDWLSLGLLREDTPAGWRRVDNGLNDTLERAEE
jgi:hypothetical protein